MTDETQAPPTIPNEVQIEINDNTTAYNHNISVRITDGRGVINPEELSKIALQRAHEARNIVKDGFNK